MKRDAQGNIYVNVSGCGADPQHKADKYQIEIKKTYEDIITYNVKEYFCDSVDNCNENILIAFDTTFEIMKENKTWKVNSYIDCYYYYTK